MMKTKAGALLLFLALAISLILFSRTVGHSIAGYFFGPYGPIIPVTTHIVLFQFKPDTAPLTVKEVSE